MPILDDFDSLTEDDLDELLSEFMTSMEASEEEPDPFGEEDDRTCKEYLSVKAEKAEGETR